MTTPANAQPAPGTNPSMPTPAAPAPEAKPGGEPVSTPPQGEPQTLSNSPVNAESSASAQNQAQQRQAAEPAPAAEPAAPSAQPFTLDTGNDTFNQAGQLMADKGMTNATQILEKAAKGELSIADKAEMVDALGDGVASMVLSQLDREMNAQREAGNRAAGEAKAKLAELLGQPAEQADAVWDALNNFAKTEESGFTASDRDALNKMLRQGGMAADMAMKELATRYQQSQGFTIEPNLMSGQTGMAQGFEPLSKTDYQTQIREAVGKYGEGSREVEALRNRRMISIQRGYN